MRHGLSLEKEGGWGERRGSNPRQPESQSGTLPTELRPPQSEDSSMFVLSLPPPRGLMFLL
jgi:hypothetical protein